MGHYKKVQKITLTATISPSISNLLNELCRDHFFKSRSQAIEYIIALYLYDYGYISQEELEDIEKAKTKYEEVEEEE